MNWRGHSDLGGNCPACAGEIVEICANNIDDDCDGELDESSYGECVADVPCDGDNDAASAQCDGTCRMRGEPVDLWTKQMYVGPHEAARVGSDQGGSADLSFEVLFDSIRGSREDNGIAKGDGTEEPHVLDVGPGFRHRYADRLIVRTPSGATTPAYVMWDSMRGRIHFYRVATGWWKAEPGTNASLMQSGSTWRLLAPGGDVLEFTDTALGTSNHPHGIWGKDDHVRLRAIYPGATPARRILLQYEDDPTDSAAPYDADKLPAPACTDLVPGALNNNCSPSRGLLVKVGVVFGTAQPFGHGPSFELKYTFGGGGTAPQQFLISEIRNGADRIDGETQFTYATLGYTSTTPRRLETVKNKVACNSSNDSCTVVKYVWDTSGYLTAVRRPGTNAAGTAATLLDEESFTWSVGVLSGHSSPGVTLAFSGVGATQPTMSWTRNGAPFDFRFDGNGNPLTCSDGSCGYAGNDKLYQTSAEFGGAFTLGPSAVKNADGTWTFRRYTERGNLDLECTVVPTSATAAPTCVLGGPLGGDGVVITNGTMRRIERRYYENVAFAERLRAVAEYDPETGNTEFEMPLSMPASWLTSQSDLSTCATLDPTYLGARTNKLSVTVYDYNSNGGSAFGDAVLSTTAMPDLLPVRVNRAASSDGDSTTRRLCTTWERNDQGRVATERSFSSGVLRSTSTMNYHSIPADKTPSTGRLQTVTRYRTPSAATDSIVVLQSCSASTRYDDEGRLACFEVPQASGSSTTVTRTTLAGNGVYAQRRVIQVSGGGTTVTTFANELASGFVFESGVGDGGSGGAVEGNRVRRLFDGTGNAASQATVGAVEHYDSSLVSTGLVWKSTESHNAYGFPLTSKVFQGSSTLRSQQDRTAIDEDGRAETVVQLITGSTSTTTSYAYGAPGWDVLTDVWEADGDHVEYVHGGLSDAAVDFGRQLHLKRGGVVLQQTAHKRDGATAAIYNPQMTSTPVSEYSYDALRRLTKEDRRLAGQVVQYYWLDDARLSGRTVRDTNNAVVEDVSYGYDGLGRLTRVTALSGSIYRAVKTIRYDDKGTYANTWNGVTMTSSFNRGRVAYVEDESGATFYEYDGAGRTAKIIRYEGPLSTWNPTANPLKVITLGYGIAGELSTITYPSGRTVTYGYGNDKERPTSVSTSGLGTVASGITYEPSGAPSFWRFEGVTGRDRAVSRDYLGRVTRLLDRYASATWSDVSYAYDGDGDVTSETDSSPTGTWLRSTTTAPQTRKYGYETARQKDILRSWDDDGSLESVVYGSDGRRSTETDGATTFTYSYSSTWPERMLSKTNSSVTSSQEVIYGFDAAGRMTTVDSSANGTTDVTLGYGPQGNLAMRTISTGAYVDKYDHDMRLVGIDDPTGSNRRFRYAFGRAPLEETRTTTSGTWTYETIYVAGEAIAQVADSPTSSPTLRNFHTDRMGIVRKTATTTGTSLYRVVFDPWGGTNSVAGSAPMDNNIDPMPSVGWRYPGQYNTGSNGWRHYLSLTGQYSSVDPYHMLGASAGIGPQAYAYAAAAPLVYVDSDGLKVFLCMATAEIPCNPLGLQHHWLKTDDAECGMGPAAGGVPGEGRSDLPFVDTTVNPHPGRSARPGAKCIEIPDVDEECVNRELTPGRALGRWTPLNQCQTFAAQVISKCRSRPPPPWDAPWAPPPRPGRRGTM